MTNKEALDVYRKTKSCNYATCQSVFCEDCENNVTGQEFEDAVEKAFEALKKVVEQEEGENDEQV